ncbi:Glycosyl hydrolase family 10 protein [Striga hermonthica]|uniref:Glycosyl hydrolase family 10 protein n=1 Tax=Striga hermonthica TaxID=68872 RepID=A0A9N7MRI7_STRHE|nr:Glycosyl hydrolase family 10 protein [Striga hermonthica]
MGKLLNSYLLFIFSEILLSAGFQAYAVDYDYSFTDECLEKPHRPQYKGGIVVNPELHDGFNGWKAFGGTVIEHRECGNNNYIVATKRSHSFDSVTQTFDLEEDKIYTFSAWLQVSDGSSVDIAAMMTTNKGYKIMGWVTAQEGCWLMLKGGLSNVSGTAQLYFESQNSKVDIWVDSVSLQPFTKEEWKSHQEQSVNKVRKSKVKFVVVDQKNQPIPNATVSMKQNFATFPFGCAINNNILNNPKYQNWFTSRFKLSVFENELKWYSTEYTRGHVDYSTSDALLKFCDSHNISVRGHNILWDVKNGNPSWVQSLPPDALRRAANDRTRSVVSKYRGRFRQWDVVNENIHGSFYENALGSNASAVFYEMTNEIDPNATLFLNDYNTIEECRDGSSSPWKYLQKIKDFRDFGYEDLLGIGLEGHFSYLNLPYIRATIDVVAAAKLPIWVTELDVSAGPNQASFLDQIINELYAHPKMEGILLWSAWNPHGCYQMCLTDNNFKNLATGDVVDNFISYLTHNADSPGSTDSNGIYEKSLFHGEYEVTVQHPNGVSSSRQIDVVPRDEAQGLHVLSIQI